MGYFDGWFVLVGIVRYCSGTKCQQAAAGEWRRGRRLKLPRALVTTTTISAKRFPPDREFPRGQFSLQNNNSKKGTREVGLHMHANSCSQKGPRVLGTTFRTIRTMVTVRVKRGQFCTMVGFRPRFQFPLPPFHSLPRRRIFCYAKRSLSLPLLAPLRIYSWN